MSPCLRSLFGLLISLMAPLTHASAAFTPESTVGDLLAHPAFRGCSRFLLPLDMGATAEMKLGETNRLLPYHSHIRTEETVRCLNAMAEAATQGQQLFYPVYSESERRADPSREEAGVFFFPGKKGAPFALICPGGGFTYEGSIHEGFPHARRIAAQGYNALVLHYRTGNGNAACRDMAAAVTYLLGHAEQLGIRRKGYSVWGSSAGARLAAVLGSYAPRMGLPRPAAVIMAYTGHTDYTPQDPPTFVVQGERDWIASPAVVRRRVQAMRRAGIPVELHTYPSLGHGFGLGLGTETEGWHNQAIRFWEAQLPPQTKRNN